MKLKALLLAVLLLLPVAALAGQNQTASKTLTINVVSNLTITTTSLPAATVGQAYTATLTATGGTAPYTWAVSTGTGQTGLPSGLTLSSAGVLSGTVNTSACTSGTCAFTFTVTVTDSTGATASIKTTFPEMIAKR